MKGQRIVVSGAANGIGTAICLDLLSREASVIGIDLEPFEDSELDRKISPTNRQYLEFVQGDASDQRLMTEFFEGLNYCLNGLVNNAGLLGGDNSHGGRNVDSLQKMIRHHAQSAFVLTELIYPKMIDGGSIVNIGSIDLHMIMPEAILYCAAKSALWGLTLGYCVTLAKYGIRVNMISPGNVNTERNIAQYAQVGELVRFFEGKTPLQRSAEPGEVAKAVAFLLSSQSSFITGADITVDGGFTRASWDPSWTEKDLTKIYK